VIEMGYFKNIWDFLDNKTEIKYYPLFWGLLCLFNIIFLLVLIIWFIESKGLSLGISQFYGALIEIPVLCISSYEFYKLWRRLF